MIKEIEKYFEINRYRVESGQSPHNYRLFIVSQDIFQELVEAEKEKGQSVYSASFIERGYRNHIYQGIPVVWNDDIAGRGVVVIEDSLIDALNEMGAHPTIVATV